MTSIGKYLEASREILGMNDRIFTYLPLNAGKSFIADDKIVTKSVLNGINISTPETIATISSLEELSKFDFEKLPNSFVLKPSDGFKGAGINIYYNRLKDGRWLLADKTKHDADDIKRHVLDILEGQFSLASKTRKKVAIFEERIRMIGELKPYSYRGIPDIRVIVFKNVPVMAMLRLPTADSHGKANLNRGAIGVGIDMARGVTTTAIKSGRVIENVPGTNIKLSGIKIPNWNKILRISSRCQSGTDLGFLGVDIIIDKVKGPLVVELNARPGLSIQVANQSGLKDRLKRVNKLKNISEERAVRIGMDLFGGEIEEEIENISGREIIGLKEEITIFTEDGQEIKAQCKIDTGAHASSIDREILKKIGHEKLLKFYDRVVPENIIELEKPERKKISEKLKKNPLIEKIIIIRSASGSDFRMLISIPVKVKDKEFIMKATVANRAHLSHQILLGIPELKYFFIDSMKK